QLPVISGHKSQMIQLFQNLIGNSLKYRSERKPEINIKFQLENNYYKFIFEDNGIGIDEKYYDKIFVIFQRLHNKDKFSETGIGLAICKKIVEKHKGKIWVESKKGAGSKFIFLLPKK